MASPLPNIPLALQGFMDIIRDMTAASGTLHVIEGLTGSSVAVVNEWYVPLRVELLSIKQALRVAARYLHMISQLHNRGPPDITIELTGHSLGGAYATILGWLYVLDAPEFSQEVWGGLPTLCRARVMPSSFVACVRVRACVRRRVAVGSVRN